MLEARRRVRNDSALPPKHTAGANRPGRISWVTKPNSPAARPALPGDEPTLVTPSEHRRIDLVGDPVLGQDQREQGTRHPQNPAPAAPGVPSLSLIHI